MSEIYSTVRKGHKRNGKEVNGDYFIVKCFRSTFGRFGREFFHVSLSQRSLENDEGKLRSGRRRSQSCQTIRLRQGETGWTIYPNLNFFSNTVALKFIFEIKLRILAEDV